MSLKTSQDPEVGFQGHRRTLLRPENWLLPRAGCSHWDHSYGAEEREEGGHRLRLEGSVRGVIVHGAIALALPPCKWLLLVSRFL